MKQRLILNKREVAKQRRGAEMTIQEKRIRRNKLRNFNGHVTFEKSMFYLQLVAQKQLEKLGLT